MTTTTSTAPQTRTMIVSILHLEVVEASGARRALPQTAESTDEACHLVAAALGIEARSVSALYNFATGNWTIKAGGRVVSLVRTERVTRDELIPWTWYMSGAANFPASIAGDGSASWSRTGGTGKAAGELVAQYKNDCDLGWFTMAGTPVDAAGVAVIEGA